MAYQTTIITFALLLLAGCAAKPRIQGEPVADIECPTTLQAASGRLIEAGFLIEQIDEKSFATAFKRSDKESKTFLLGAPLQDRYRKIDAVATRSGISYSLTDRVVTHPHPNDEDQTKREEVGPTRRTTVRAPMLQALHLVICSQVVAAPAADKAPPPAETGPTVTPTVTPKRDALDFIRERCETGDKDACTFLEQQR